MVWFQQLTMISTVDDDRGWLAHPHLRLIQHHANGLCSDLLLQRIPCTKYSVESAGW